VRTFDVGQSALDGSIGLLMAVDDWRGSDHVFLSLLNSPINTSWLGNPVWILREFNADNVESKAITVRGAFFAEVSYHQYVVVDVDRPEEQPRRAVQEGDEDEKASRLWHIERYHIDEGKWVKHDVPVDIESGDYQSCVGRVRKEQFDGIYTKGKAGESAQLVYVPIVNMYGPSPPLPIVLNPPEGKIPSAIAAARNPNKEQDSYACTDLYVITDSTLYRLDDKTQHSRTGKAAPLVTDGILAGTTTLLATIRNGVTTLWGKNGSDQVFYLSCAQDNLANPDFWSAPVPVLSRIEKISAYMNRVDGGNTIFATDGNNLYRLTQETGSGNKLWRSEQIQLAADPTEPLLEITSFTTTIKVNEAGTGIPAMNTKVAISANSRTSVYINGTYYALDITPVQVETDATGIVTVIEATSDVNGTILTVSGDSNKTSTVINPMEQAFNKLTGLNSVEKLRSAQVCGDPVAGGMRSSTQFVPLIDKGVQDGDVDTVAKSLASLGKINTDTQRRRAAKYPRNAGIVPSALLKHYDAPAPTAFGLENVWDHIAIAAGDLFQWLKSVADAVVDIVFDETSKVWQFLAKISGKIYYAVVDGIEAAVGAAVWIFNAVKTGIKHIIDFVAFLFEWDDIQRTKEVMHNVTKQYLEYQVGQISVAREKLDDNIEQVEKTISAWAGMDWQSLGDSANKPVADDGSDPNRDHTAGSQLLSNHFRDNVKDLTLKGSEPPCDVVHDLVSVLLQAISDEGKVLSGAYNQLKDLATQFASLTVGQVLAQLAGILVNGILSSVRVVADALLDVLVGVLKDTVALLDCKIHVPIISDILNKLGFPDISFLDLFT